MSYAKRNEIGYDFMIHNTKREVSYYDGISLVFLPKELSSASLPQLGFNNAAKKRARQRRKVISDNETIGFQKLVKIEKGLQKKISELTGITDEMLANSGEGIDAVLGLCGRCNSSGI